MTPARAIRRLVSYSAPDGVEEHVDAIVELLEDDLVRVTYSGPYAATLRHEFEEVGIVAAPHLRPARELVRVADGIAFWESLPFARAASTYGAVLDEPARRHPQG